VSSSPESWNEKYRRGEEAGDDPDPLVIEAADLVRAGFFALDIACGRGRNARYLANRGFSVLALDFSDVAISNLHHPRIEARVVNLETDPLPDQSFDLICSIRYLQRSLFPWIRNALRPDGIFAAHIAMQDDDPALRPMNPEYLIASGELASAFEGFEILRNEECKLPAKRRVSEFLARAKNENRR